MLEAGCVLLPLNIRLSPEELAFVINDAQARFLFIDPLFLPLVESLRAAVVSVGFFFVLQGRPRAGWLAPVNYDDLLSDVSPFNCDFTRIDEDSVAELFYTSGSSDRPRGVIFTHRSVYLHALSAIAAGQTSPNTLGDMSCCCIPSRCSMPTDGGTAHTITLVGGTHVMIHHFSPTEVFRLIESERVTTCAMVPTMVNALVHSPEREKYDLNDCPARLCGPASIVLILSASEPLLGRKFATAARSCLGVSWRMPASIQDISGMDDTRPHYSRVESFTL